MKTVFIYTLSTLEEPDNIRYVGKADDTKKRLEKHLQSYYLKDVTYKNNWLKSVIRKGYTPIISIIDEVLESEWQYWEKYWIAQFKAWEFKLTNATPGGEGNTITKEMAIKIGKMNFDRNTIKLKDEIIKFKVRQENNLWVAEKKCPCCDDLIIYKNKKRHLVMSCARRAEKESRTCTKCEYENRSGSNNYFFGKTHSPEQQEILRNLAHKKSVYMYSKNGNLLNVFISIREAEKQTGISRRHISNCCNNKLHCYTASGYVFKFKGEPFELKKQNFNCTPVIQKDKLGNTISKYNSITDAANATMCSIGSISSCCKNLPKHKTSGGFIWEYA